MRAALLRLCRRLHISWLRSRQTQIRCAIDQAVLDPSPADTTLIADLMVEFIELDIRIEGLEAQS